MAYESLLRPNNSIDGMPLLTTGDLNMSLYALKDADEIFKLIERNRDFFSQDGEETGKKYLTVEEVIKSIVFPDDPGRLRFTIRRHSSGVLLGAINLTPRPKAEETRGEIGYFVGQEFGGQGIATTAVRAITNYGLESFPYTTLFGAVALTNLASRRVLEKNGYRDRGYRFTENGREYMELVKARDIF